MTSRISRLLVITFRVMMDTIQIISQKLDPSKWKFPPEVMVWIAVSECGHSFLYFNVRYGTMDSKTYSKECINKRLVPFIRKHHSDGRYIFWLGGAKAH